MSARTLTLTTDFGESDSYVAQMKGVVVTIAPDVRILDLSHALPPQGVRAAARFLAEAVPRFPAGTVHVCVIDPGVGGERRPLALAWRGQYLVGPDNGLFEAFLDDPDRRVVSLDRTERWLGSTSATFHGRDVFAPVGAHLANGATLDEVGSALSDPVRLPASRPTRTSEGLRGEVVHVDHFGNVITNVHRSDLGSTQSYAIRLGTLELEGPARSYDAVPEGHALTLFGSSGYVEIAVHRGRADQLGAAPGDSVVVQPREAAP